MKLKNLFLAALAGSMVFASCTSEETVAPVDKKLKSVTINLANVIGGTRGTDTPIQNQTHATLNNFQVFFVDDNGNLKQGYTVKNNGDKDAITKHFFKIGTGTDEINVGDFNTNSGENYTFHFLPSNVNKVVVIGNLANEIDVTADKTNTLNEVLSVAESKYTNSEGKLTVYSQQNDQDLYLYGEDASLTSKSEDKYGHPRYQADVNLTPRVSRVEISGFDYKKIDDNTARLYSNIKVEQVLFGNYYPYATKLNGATSGEIVLDKDNVSESTVFNIFDDQENNSDNDKWRSDFLDGTSGNLSVVNLTGEADNMSWPYEYSNNTSTNRPAYHFFPNGSEKPQLVIKLLATLNKNTIPLYLATKNFNPAINNDLNTVYVVDFEFDDKDLKNPEKCIDVKVTVANWVIKAVTPDFGN